MLTKIVTTAAFVVLWFVFLIGMLLLTCYWMIDTGIEHGVNAVLLYVISFFAIVYAVVDWYFYLRYRWYPRWQERRETKRVLRAHGYSNADIERGPDFLIHCEEHERAEFMRDPQAFIRKKILAHPDDFPADFVEWMRADAERSKNVNPRS